MYALSANYCVPPNYDQAPSSMGSCHSFSNARRLRRRGRDSRDLRIQVYGPRDGTSSRATAGRRSAQARASLWSVRADWAHADLAYIESLPAKRAVEFIETRRAQALEGGHAAAIPVRRPTVSEAHRTQPPESGLGLGL